MRHKTFISASVVALLTLAACTSNRADDETAGLKERIAEQDALIAEREATIEELRAAPETGPSPAAPFSAEGLTDQLHAHFLDDLPEGFEPGPTPWRDRQVPAGFGADGDRFDTPGAAMVALADAVGGAEGLGSESWEIAVRVLSPEAGDRARGAVLMWGFRDDSVAGTDVRVDLRRDGAGWYVRAAETRDHCWRGVTDGLCV